jgi:hypothetical protein
LRIIGGFVGHVKLRAVAGRPGSSDRISATAHRSALPGSADAANSIVGPSPGRTLAAWTTLAPTALLALDGVSHEPELRGPQSDEQRPPLGVPSLILIDGLGPDPEPDAQRDRSQRGDVEIPAAKTHAMKTT